MESVLNSDKDHAEIIATYVDSVLKGRIGKDKLAESDMDTALAGVLNLLQYMAVRWVATARLTGPMPSINRAAC